MRRLLELTLCLALAACNSPAPAGTPTATRVPMQTPPPTATKIAEPAQIAIDIAEVAILAPGPDSLVTSPLAIRAQLAPGADGRARIELADAGGRLLAVQVVQLASSELQTELIFELGRPSLPARLTVSTLDEYGRTRALNSVDLTLLASGAASIFPPAETEQIVIERPQAGAQLAGGSLLVSGQALTQPGRPLTVQLVTRAGRVLASGEVYPANGAFEVEFNLDLDEATWVQVAVSERGGLAPGVAHFKGVEVLVDGE